jgi:hypothetical protein
LLSATVDLGHVDEEIEDTAGVAPLIVIPRYELHEVVVEGDTCLGVEDGAMWVTIQITGDEVVFAIGKYSYKMSVSWFSRTVGTKS